jgi:hypothetical protein
MITILKSLTQAICHVWGICRYPDKERSSNRSKAFRDLARGGGGVVGAAAPSLWKYLLLIYTYFKVN